MKFRGLGAFLFGMIVLAANSSNAFAENLVQDSLFKSAGTPSSFKTFKRGKKIGPWDVTSGSVDHKGKYWQESPGGGNSIDLDGDDRGSISQKVKTEKGVEYVVSFAFTGNWEGGEATKKLEVTVGKTKKTYSIRRPAGWSRRNMVWTQQSFPYLGDGKSVSLVLKSRSRSSRSSHGPVVADISVAPAEEVHSPPPSLDTIPVPTPKNLANYVRDKESAILLGKALFWDMQVGSDGRTACASCHWQAGADSRTKNTLYPGAPGSAFGSQRPGQEELEEKADFLFFARNRINIHVTKDDYPTHKVKFPNRKRGSDNPVLRDSPETTGSQGVVEKTFDTIVEGNPVDRGTPVDDPEYHIDGVSTRQITIRNTPTMINAVFNDRQFWDGRANRFFNGVNEFGDLDKDARVWVSHKSNTFEDQLAHIFEKYPQFRKYEHIFRKYKWIVRWFLGSDFRGRESLRKVRILIDDASLASQAVGPPLSSVEMSWLGRSFPELARKMFSLKPLAMQQVHGQDSVLGSYANNAGTGLKSGVNYPRLIREAFKEKWWKSSKMTPDGFTLMESNFSLFWGLAINLYEATLVSDQTPYDNFAKGDENALSESARRGLDIFLNEGKCINCHEGSEFTGATVSAIRSSEPDFIEFMEMQRGPKAFYDNGFYNIGVRQTLEDIGVGAAHPEFGPLSYTRQRQNGRNVGQNIKVPRNARVAVDGAFKTPGLRNIELTGPYMHNGGMKSLTEVVQFYTRGADFFKENIDDLDPDVDGISELQGDDEKIQDVVNFMKALTDDRVRHRRAPFDHPEIILPNGHSGVENGVALDITFTLPAVGKDGGEPLIPFEQRLKDRNSAPPEPPKNDPPKNDPPKDPPGDLPPNFEDLLKGLGAGN